MRQEDYSKDWVMHNGKSGLREEDEGGRAMVMRDDERCGQEAEQRSGYGDQQVERWRESCM